MKVFVFTYNKEYGGGCSIVIANSPEEAFGLLVSNFQFADDYTDIDHCKEITTLVPASNVTEPTIVSYHFYQE